MVFSQRPIQWILQMLHMHDLNLQIKVRSPKKDRVTHEILFKNFHSSSNHSLRMFYFVFVENAMFFGFLVTKYYLQFTVLHFTHVSMEDGRSTSLCSLYGQLSQGRMADFPVFLASKSFDPWNHHIPQMKWHNLWHILMH